MSDFAAVGALREYRQVKVSDVAEDMPRERLVQMLFEGAAERLAAARGHMQRGEVAAKGLETGRAISILSELRSSLDAAAAPDLVANLDSLYDYMQRRLLEGNLRNDVAALDEVARLIGELKGAWDTIVAAGNTGA
jgi:flagellar protein FliS